MNTIVELESSDSGETWRLISETAIKQPPMEYISQETGLGQIPTSLVTSRNGKQAFQSMKFQEIFQASQMMF